MDTNNRYYQYSGALTPQGLFLMLIFGAIGSAVLSVLYGYGINYIPFVLAHIILTCALGFAVGLLVGKGAILGRVRRPRLVMITGVIFGVAAEYGGWVAWIYAASKQEILIFSPKPLLAFVGAVADNGSWSLSGWTPTGWVLYIVWFVEAALIIGLAAVAASSTASVPFCETCSKWLEKKELLPEREWVSEPQTIKTHLENGNYKILTDLKMVKSYRVANYTLLEVTLCDKCLGLYLLSVKTVIKGTNKKGEETSTSSAIVSNLIIDAYTYGNLKKKPEPKEPEESRGG